MTWGDLPRPRDGLAPGRAVHHHQWRQRYRHGHAGWLGGRRLDRQPPVVIGKPHRAVKRCDPAWSKLRDLPITTKAGASSQQVTIQVFLGDENLVSEATLS